MPFLQVLALAVTFIGTASCPVSAESSKESSTPQIPDLIPKQVLTESLLAWDGQLSSHFVYRARMDSSTTRLYVHCKPRDFSDHGCLVRWEDGEWSTVQRELPASYVWWNDDGEVVAYSDLTAPGGRAVGDLTRDLKGTQTVNILGENFQFGDGSVNSHFDISEDGQFIYIVTYEDDPEDVSLRVLRAQSPDEVIHEQRYPKAPRLFLRGDTLHIFSDVSRRYGNRRYSHETLDAATGSIRSESEIKAKRTFFSSFYSVFALNADASSVFVSCVVDMPFGGNSHYQRIPLDGTQAAEKLRDFRMGSALISVPANLRAAVSKRSACLESSQIE